MAKLTIELDATEYCEILYEIDGLVKRFLFQLPSRVQMQLHRFLGNPSRFCITTAPKDNGTGKFIMEPTPELYCLLADVRMHTKGFA